MRPETQVLFDRLSPSEQDKWRGPIEATERLLKAADEIINPPWALPMLIATIAVGVPGLALLFWAAHGG